MNALDGTFSMIKINLRDCLSSWRTGGFLTSGAKFDMEHLSILMTSITFMLHTFVYSFLSKNGASTIFYIRN